MGMGVTQSTWVFGVFLLFSITKAAYIAEDEVFSRRNLIIYSFKNNAVYW